MASFPDPTQLFREVERQFGLPQDAFLRIATQNDWSFLIQAHAIVEAAATHTLSNATDPRLRKRFERLGLSDSDIGKIAFLADLGDVDPDTKTFLGKLSKLRNEAVHDVERLTFSFAKHVQSLDKNQRDAFRKFCGFYSRKYSVPDRAKELERCLDNAKLSILVGVVQVVSHLYMNDLKRSVDNAEHGVKDRFYDEMRKIWGEP